MTALRWMALTVFALAVVVAAVYRLQIGRAYARVERIGRIGNSTA